MTSQAHYFCSARIIFGWGCLDQLTNLAFPRVAVVTDRTSMEPLGFLERALTYLKQAGAKTEVLPSVEGEPELGTVLSRLDAVRAFAPDAIVALGGGSVIDVAKALRILYDHPNAHIEDYLTWFDLPWTERRTKLVAIPSTSGTGSETTIVAVFTDPKQKVKRLMMSRDLQADIAIVDPEIPSHMPPKLTAWTGMDCLAQAIESLVTTWATPFTQAMGLQAIRLAFENLRSACRESTRESRERMHYASTISALSMTNSNAGLGHAMDQVGPQFNLHHGLTVAILLPYTIEFNWQQAKEHYARAAQAIGITDAAPEAAVARFLDELDKLESDIGIPYSFQKAGIAEPDFLTVVDSLAQWTIENGAGQVSPRPPTLDEARGLFLDAYYGRRLGLRR